MQIIDHRTVKGKKTLHPFVKNLLVAGGILASIVGVIGIFVPLLPTTPFLLLASWCFTRSSEKLNHRLMTSQLLGPYIRNYREKNGITKRNKLYSLTFLWLTLLFSFIMSPPWWWLWLMLASIGIGVSYHIISFKTLK